MAQNLQNYEEFKKQLEECNESIKLQVDEKDQAMLRMEHKHKQELRMYKL